MTQPGVPEISIVIPTFDRIERLKIVLDALGRQTLDHTRFETIVVSDGSTDGTDEYLESATTIPVVFARQENSGAGAARNRGLGLARGRLVLFIDDDIVATPTLLERHIAAHGDSDSTVMIGPMLNAEGFEYSAWVAWEQAMLYKQYKAMRRGKYPAGFRQFYTGNASVPRAMLAEAGGFDTTFRRAEDIELAYRLHQLGATFVFDESAAAHHWAERSFDSWLAAASAYGRNDVTFARDHEQHWLMPAMGREFSQRNRLTRLLVMASLGRPRLARSNSVALRTIGITCRRIPTISAQALSGLYGLSYYLGAAEEYDNTEDFRSVLRGNAPPQTTVHG